MKGNTLIQFALVNNKAKHLDDITRLDEPICLECEESLILRNGEKNVKHLAHKPDSSCTYRNEKEYTRTGAKESYEHKYAKRFIADNLSFFREYGSHIIVKDGEFKLGGYTDLKIDSIELECRGLKNELNLNNEYIPDILIRAEGKLIALEIYKSNKKDPQELRELLKGKGVSVYEVDINHMEKLTIKGIFSHMKLIYSDLKEQFNAAMNPIQEAIIENRNLKDENIRNKRAVEIYKEQSDEMSQTIQKLQYELNYAKQSNNYKNNSYEGSQVSYYKGIVSKLLKEKKQQQEENAKCWKLSSKYWYGGFNDIISKDIKKCEKGSEEYSLLMSVRGCYNGLMGAYGTKGGDDRLKSIAKIVRNYEGSKKYLGVDNEMFLDLLGMEYSNTFK